MSVPVTYTDDPKTVDSIMAHAIGRHAFTHRITFNADGRSTSKLLVPSPAALQQWRERNPAHA